MVLISQITLPVCAQMADTEYDWEEKLNENGITIFTSNVDDSPFKAVRGEMIVKGTVIQLVELIFDLQNCPNWADLCKESITVKHVSDLELYIYVYNDIPFPVKDRDVVVHVVWSKNQDSGKVTMHSSATNLELSNKLRAISDSAVRLTSAISQWHFTPLDDGKVLVENFAHIDPNGPTPAWLTNLLLVKSPYKSMRNMRDIIQSGKYADQPTRF